MPLWVRRGDGFDVNWADTAMGPRSAWPEELDQVWALILHARQPMVVAWGSQRAMLYNQAFAPIAEGKPLALGQPMGDIFFEAWESVADFFMAAEAGDSVYVEDHKVPLLRHGSVENSWWTLSYSPVHLQSGEIGGVLCIMHETTRAHVAEQKEAALRRELSLVTDLVPSLLWRADRFGRPNWQNGRLRTLSSASGGCEVGNLWKHLVHPEDLPVVVSGLAEAKIERKPFARPVRIRDIDGSYRWHLARSQPTFDDTGSIAGWYGVATDIHDAQDAIRTLDEREALFAKFAANSASLLWTVDFATWDLKRLSPNFGEVWPGLDEQADWGWRDFLGSIHDLDRSAVEAGFSRVRLGEAASGRFRVRVNGDGLRLLDANTFPIFDAAGRVQGMGGSLKDITPINRSYIHVIDADAARQNGLSHALRKRGFTVRVFDSVNDFVSVAGALRPAPVLYRFDGAEPLDQLSGFLSTALPESPWMVILPGDPTPGLAVQIMKRGASDVLEAGAETDEICLAIGAVCLGKEAIDGAPLPTEQAIHRLTLRERQVLDGLITGGTNKTIAARLALSPRTVEAHRSRLMEKLGARTLAELVARATSPDFRTAQARP